MTMNAVGMHIPRAVFSSANSLVSGNSLLARGEHVNVRRKASAGRALRSSQAALPHERTPSLSVRVQTGP